LPDFGLRVTLNTRHKIEELHVVSVCPVRIKVASCKFATSQFAFFTSKSFTVWSYWKVKDEHPYLARDWCEQSETGRSGA
jgi:hypothetical protein